MKTDFSSVAIQDDWLPILEKITNELVLNGYSITDNLLSESEILAIKHRFNELLKQNEFEKSGIGKNVLHQINDEIRGDFIRWIETTDLPNSIKPYYDFIHQLINYFNEQLYIGIKDLESHYAYYPKGKGYLKHRDRFKKNPHRVISIVLYLNESWKPNDGGELVLYDDKLQEIIKIPPVFNRVAVFKSEMIHEVLPCSTSRFSITTWLIDKEKELTFL